MIFRVTIYVLLLILITEARMFDEVTSEQLKLLELLDTLELKEMQKLRDVYAIERENVKYEVSNEEHRNELKNYGKQRQNPPPVEALMARYIVNQANWTSLATLSSRKGVETFPSVNVISVSDGPLGNGSGIPYCYLDPRDITTKDLAQDHRASLMMSLAQGDYCKKRVWDPMDPRCGRIVLTGRIKAIKNNSAELQIAKNAVFGRHPLLDRLSAGHHFFFVKLNIIHIVLLDAFGGPKMMSVEDYLHPSSSNVADEFLQNSSMVDKDYDDEFYDKHDVKPLMDFFDPVAENV